MLQLQAEMVYHNITHVRRNSSGAGLNRLHPLGVRCPTTSYGSVSERLVTPFTQLVTSVGKPSTTSRGRWCFWVMFRGFFACLPRLPVFLFRFLDSWTLA